MSAVKMGGNGRSRATAVIIVLVLALMLATFLLTGCTTANDSSTTNGAGGTSTTAAGSRPTTGSTVEQPGDITVSPAEAVARGVSPSIVNVNAGGTTVDPYFGSEQQVQGVGSGIILSADGMIVTNNHVVTVTGNDGVERPADTLTVTLKTGEEMPARLIGRDPFTDVAVIKVDRTDLPPANFLEDRSEVQVGEYAVAIGSPQGYTNTVSLGIVSGLQRNIQNAGVGPGAQALIDLIQTDAPISPGNSGGSLVDAYGRVIGMNVAYLPPSTTGAQNIGFAIPADTVVSVAQQIIDTGKVSHAYLGIRYEPVTAEMQQQFNLPVSKGIAVTNVGQGTPADEAGIQQGDIITAVDGTEIENDGTLLASLRQRKAGDQLTLTVNRDGKSQDIEVTLAERPTTAQ